MPHKPRKPCKHPGCPNLTSGRFCTKHSHLDDTRANAAQRGYDARWQKARARYLTLHPWCRKCSERNRLVEATVVDHIVPHRGDEKLFWDESNWQPLCKPCHDRKTKTEDGPKTYTY